MNNAKTIRALIIAVQHYPVLKEASVLDGTLKDARKFVKWLMQFKRVPAPNIWVCATSQRNFPKGVTVLSATKDKIKEAIESLVLAGRDKTSELYVFYSGHGFLVQLNRDDAGESVIVPTDFSGPKNSLDKLIRIPELYKKLSIWLGGNKHFYFVDACRNVLNAEYSILGLSLDAAEKNKHPEVNFLGSTLPGSTTVVRSGFGPALVDGLSRNMLAAEPLDGRYFVTARSLRKFIETTLRRQLDDNPSSGYGQIIEVLPNQSKNKFRIVAETADQGDQFLGVLRNSAPKRRKTIRFSGHQSMIAAKPDTWNSIQLFRGKEEWHRIAPAPPQIIDFSKACDIVFRPPSKDVKLGFKPTLELAEADAGESTKEVRRILVGGAPKSIAQSKWDRLIDAALEFGSEETKRKSQEIRVVLSNDLDPRPVFGGISEDPVANWHKPEQADGNFFFRLESSPGSKIASFAFSKGLTLSVVTFSAERWITLIVIYRDDRQRSKIVQALLPPMGFDIRMLKRAFKLQTSESSGFEAERFEETGEPITRLFGYRRYGLPASGGLYSLDFPDLIAFKPIAGDLPQRSIGAPLLLESLLTVPGWEDSLPFPANRLDYSSIWTCWRGAVNGPPPAQLEAGKFPIETR